MNDTAGTFAAVFATLFVAHSVGDHWVQTTPQARNKGRPGWPGRLAGVRHVVGLTLTKLLLLALVAVVLSLPLTTTGTCVGLAVDAYSHWWADRRSTLARLAQLLGKGEFHALGSTVTDSHGRPSHLGTGAYALDQSWHHFWLLVAALLIAAL
ncbi:DUF3307 domain-containing protein [Streptomyces sp. B6B3]|uniref:DUF3307 domain-containing protein n=1 Tax=Streptomyces sp. B6B3 TaxID=3153570 RepID=UPI00325F8C9C